MNHICTNESLVAGGDSVHCTCLWCKTITKHQIGYGGSLCLKCKLFQFDFNDYEMLLKRMMKKHNFASKSALQKRFPRLIKKKDLYKYRDEYLYAVIQTALERE